MTRWLMCPGVKIFFVW
uniref:Uncharacterized protein n=1 Tax=Anopheles minimus TaxID=112268 RepID=A0A182WPY3_9DIPT